MALHLLLVQIYLNILLKTESQLQTIVNLLMVLIIVVLVVKVIFRNFGILKILFY